MTKSLLLLILVLSITISSVVVLNASAILAKNEYFSVEAPDDWAYTGDYAYSTEFKLAPQIFPDTLDSSAPALGLLNRGVFVELEAEPDFYITNAPLGTYVKKWVGFASTGTNATVAGEPAVKKLHNSTVGGNKEFPPLPVANINTVSYYVKHNDEYYRLSYFANEKDYEKYLPVFEQMVKTFKFMK